MWRLSIGAHIGNICIFLMLYKSYKLHVHWHSNTMLSAMTNIAFLWSYYNMICNKEEYRSNYIPYMCVCWILLTIMLSLIDLSHSYTNKNKGLVCTFLSSRCSRSLQAYDRTGIWKQRRCLFKGIICNICIPIFQYSE